ncbi:MAG: WYL domain-containing protein [Clostridia bacterium]|nr:WYL domain-containing protein [Clostridia bacterium]
MIFSELYGAYYNAVAALLREASDKALCQKEMREIVERYAFAESTLSIIPAIEEERWQLMKDGRSILKHAPTMPLTTLQKRWMKAISLDPRIKLFTGDEDLFPDVEPLFRKEDIYVYDRYSDGDPYEDEGYKNRFRKILEAINNKTPLSLNLVNRVGNPIYMVMVPEYLEYSEKDDKFRLIGTGNRYGGTINLARVVDCKPYKKEFRYTKPVITRTSEKTVVFEVTDDRNALERAMLHFAHFEKSAERIDNNKYRVSLKYDKYDETEIVIRILSFGPMIKVISPDSFTELIKERLKKQKSCGLG